MTKTEIAAYYGVSIPTISRWLAEARQIDAENQGLPKNKWRPLPFPLPISPRGRKNLWRRSDIEACDPNTRYRPAVNIENSAVKHGLAMYGIKVK